MKHIDFYSSSKPIDLLCVGAEVWSDRWLKKNRHRLGIGPALRDRFNPGPCIDVVELGVDLDQSWPEHVDVKNLECFNELEHFCNPLFFLRNCRRHLEQSGGMLFLSTPLVVWSLRPTHWLKSPYHYVEFDLNQLRTLFDLAGLQVAQCVVFTNRPWWKFLTPRGLIRWIADREVFVALAPK